MSVDDNFFYYESASQRKTSKTPSNLISVPHLIRSLPYWVMPYGGKKKKPKILLLNAPELKKLELRTEIMLAERLLALENAGFKVYFVDKKGDFKLLNDIAERRFKQILDAPQLSDSDLKKKAALDLDSTHDQLFVLNKKELDILLKGTDEDLPIINASQVKYFLNGSNLNTHSFNRFLLHTAPNIEYLNVTRCLNLLEDGLSEDLNLPKLKTLIFSRPLTFRVSALGKRSHIIQKTELHPHAMYILLKAARNVKRIDLSSIHENSLTQLSNDLSFPFLEELRLRNLTPSQINIFLASGSAIKKLDLVECKELDQVSFDKIQSELLEELQLGSNLTSDQLKKLLQNPIKLKKLNLNYCKCLEGIEDLNLESVEELDLSHTNITAFQLNILLKKTPHLKKLSLRGCSIDGLILNELQCNQLEELNLYETTINMKELENFLQFTPKLKVLLLNETTNLMDKPSRDIKLDYLEDLQFSSSNVSPSLINALLSNASKLRNISSSDYKEFHLLDFEGKPLDSLEMLSLAGVTFDHKQAKALLQASPKMKSFDLYSCNLQEIITDVGVSNLKKLSIYECSPYMFVMIRLINSGSLEVFHIQLRVDSVFLIGLKNNLKRFSHLKTIDMSHCDLKEDANTLKRLAELIQVCTFEELDLSKTNLSIESIDYLRTFLKPNQKINFSTVASSTLDANKRRLDANTQPNPNAQYRINKVFYAKSPTKDPSPNLYRGEVYDLTKVNPLPCSIDDAFSIGNKSENLNLQKRPILQSNSDLYSSLVEVDGAQQYYGKQSLVLNDKWQSLASLSANETMLAYHLSNPADAQAIEIEYSLRDNLYYIRRKEGAVLSNHCIDIDFVLQVPTHKPSVLPQDLQNKVNECLEFTSQALKLETENPTGADYLAALIKQKTGACRHRSFVFKEWMNEHYPDYQTRIVNNTSHSFVEFFIDAQWMTVNLGGYPAELIINEAHNPGAESNKSKATAAQPGKATAVQLTSEGTTQPGKDKTQYFQTKIVAPKVPGPLEYVQELVSNESSKHLIQLKTDTQLDGLRYKLQHYCASTSTPYFYVHSAEDLICSAPYVERQADKGILKKGPGGPLYDFLKQQKPGGPPPILIVNYNNFSAQDLVQFNALLDKEPKADGTLLPEKTKIIALINPNNPDSYDGADFRSRFGIDGISSCPLKEGAFSTPDLFSEESQTDIPAAEINLYGGQNWEERLLGRWIMKGKELIFEEGELLPTLTRKPSIGKLVLNNTPWDDPDFTRFWQEARLSTKEIRFKGQLYPLPEGFVWPQLVEKSTHNFDKLEQIVSINPSQETPKKAKVLNPGTLSKFYGIYVNEKSSKTIRYEQGILLSHPKDQLLQLYVTEALDLDEWALFFDTCKTVNCKIELTLAPGVSLPEKFGLQVPEPSAAQTHLWLPNEPLHTSYVFSTDMDLTVHGLLQDQKDALVIDAAECTSAQLLNSLDGHFDEKQLTFSFSEETGILTKALKEKKTVVLKGPYQQELVYALHELLLQRQEGDAPGQLILMDNLETAFPEVPRRQHIPSLAERKAALTHPETFTENELASHTLTELKAMLRHKAIYPNEPAKNAWNGYNNIPERPAYTALKLKEAATVVDTFNQQRLEAVEGVLAKSPFVFLSGITGVGKTTFMQEVWKKKHSVLYVGEDHFESWAQHKADPASDEYITLFLDEATITQRHWTELEGLFYNPPWIRKDNTILHLSDKHRVILASNPLSYGGEREMPSFLKRHGNSLIFNPLPSEYIFQELLKPVFKDSTLDVEANYLPILEVDRYLNSLDKSKLLISPRELSMMALLTRSYCHRYPDANPEKVASYYAYNLAKDFVPKTHKAEFDNKFKTPEPHRAAPKLSDNFTLTANNQDAFYALSDALHLRKLRQEGNIKADGGLGGIVLEGEPGVGKTELVIKTLLAMGIEQGNIHHEHSETSVFYVMPVSMSYEDKTQLLLKAFKEGAIVVVDEFNSAPMMERLLNDLLMGKGPDGKPSKIPGFMIIGTQNPPSLAGRIRASSALQHRVQKVTVSNPLPDDMLQILVDKGLDAVIAKDMIYEYLGRNQQAKTNNLPQFCFRDLVTRAEEVIIATKKSKPTSAATTGATKPVAPEKTTATTKTADSNAHSSGATSLTKDKTESSIEAKAYSPLPAVDKESPVKELALSDNAKLAIKKIDAEIKRLQGSRKESNNLLVTIKILKSSNKKITALQALKTVIIDKSNHPDFNAELTAWNNEHGMETKKQRNIVNTFFRPKHHSITEKTVDSIFKLLDADITRVQTNPLNH